MNADAAALRARARRTQWALLAPYSLWSVLFIVVPLVFVAYYAFTDNAFGFTTEHFVRFFTATSSTDSGEVRTYLLIFGRSLKLAVISTVICLLLGYPLAYIMSRAKPRAQKIMMTLIMIPMWMNFLIRTYAWMTILQDTGILNGFLSLLGLGRVHIIGTEGAVVIGMVYDYLPFMVLPIYNAMIKIDDSLIEAAYDLGASKSTVLRKVIAPLTIPGIVSGVTMVFVPSLTTFAISNMLGGGKVNLIGNIIEQEFTTSSNWNLGSGLSLVMMIFIVISMAFIEKFDKNGEGNMI